MIDNASRWCRRSCGSTNPCHDGVPRRPRRSGGGHECLTDRDTLAFRFGEAVCSCGGPKLFALLLLGFPFHLFKTGVVVGKLVEVGQRNLVGENRVIAGDIDRWVMQTVLQLDIQSYPSNSISGGGQRGPLVLIFSSDLASDRLRAADAASIAA